MGTLFSGVRCVIDKIKGIYRIESINSKGLLVSLKSELLQAIRNDKAPHDLVYSLITDQYEAFNTCETPPNLKESTRRERDQYGRLIKRIHTFRHGYDVLRYFDINENSPKLAIKYYMRNCTLKAHVAALAFASSHFSKDCAALRHMSRLSYNLYANDRLQNRLFKVLNSTSHMLWSSGVTQAEIEHAKGISRLELNHHYSGIKKGALKHLLNQSISSHEIYLAQERFGALNLNSLDCTTIRFIDVYLRILDYSPNALQSVPVGVYIKHQPSRT